MSARLLYAAILATDRNAACIVRRSLDVVVEGRIAAVTGVPSRTNSSLTARALAHDQVMQALVERCSSVMPFRLDTRAPLGAELHRLLRDYGTAIEANLLRLQGRVEMGIKIKSTDGLSFAGRLRCERIHELAGSMQNRRERVVTLEGGSLFEGTYLIPRRSTDDFWSAVLKIPRAMPGFAVLGTGPWAPYNFCDLQLPTSESIRAQRRSA